jgi:hypothetical protein
VIDIESNTRVRQVAPNVYEISMEQKHLGPEREIRILDEVNHLVIVLEFQFDKRADYQILILCV